MDRVSPDVHMRVAIEGEQERVSPDVCGGGCHQKRDRRGCLPMYVEEVANRRGTREGVSRCTWKRLPTEEGKERVSPDVCGEVANRRGTGEGVSRCTWKRLPTEEGKERVSPDVCEEVANRRGTGEGVSRCM